MIINGRFAPRRSARSTLVVALLAVLVLLSFGETQKTTALAAPEQKNVTPTSSCDTSFLAQRFKYRVNFKIGKSDAREGGRIEIKEVWGTRPQIEVGGQYLVRGRYVLPQGVHGTLHFYASANGPWGETASLDLQSTDVDKPDGEFALVHGMAGEGYFHLIFTETSNYSNWFADVYFGTGENVYGTTGPAPKSRETQADNLMELLYSRSRIPGLEGQIADPKVRDIGTARTMLDILLSDKNLKLPRAVRFQLGQTQFEQGDRITISEIRGTSDTFSAGNVYVIKGTYTLKSHATAMFAAYTTADDMAHALGNPLAVQSVDVVRGSGSFQLVLPMWCEGWPHLSFYAGGGSISGVYFGTGDTVLKHW